MKKVRVKNIGVFCFKKMVSLILCIAFGCQYTLLPVLAVTDISGVSGSNGVYNIDPLKHSGSTGFRHYENFNLSEGDIANLIMKFGAENISRFINIVDNRINIDGLVNTMRDGAFANGHAIFVSPNGMVVGASGVLNVGALSIITPSSAAYGLYRGAYGSGALTEDLSALKSTTGSEGLVKINGKIFARDGVDIHAKNVEISKNALSQGDAAIISGMDANTYNQAMTSNLQADNLFNQIINTGNVTRGTNFAHEGGKIVIVAKSEIITDTDIPINTASVKLKDAYLNAQGIDISAHSKTTYEKTGDFNMDAAQAETMLDALIAGTTIPLRGAVSEAIVEIDNSILISQGDITLASLAEAETNLTQENTSKSVSVYAIGDKTKSIVEVKNNSVLNAKNGDVLLEALSQNTMNVKLVNEADPDDQDDSSLKIAAIYASSEAQTKASLDTGSKVYAKNLDVKAVNQTSHSIESKYEAKFGKNEAEALVGVIAVINNNNIDTQAIIDTKLDVANTGEVNLAAQTLYQSTTKVEVSAAGVDKEENTQNQSAEQTEKNDGLLDKIKNLINDKTVKNTEAAPSGGEQQVETVAAVSGAVIVNMSDINTEAKLGKNTEMNVKDVNVNANLVDLTLNNAVTGSENAKYAPGASVIVNIQDNKTKAHIEDGTAAQQAKITASNKVNLNATSELPMNRETLDMLLGAKDAVVSVFSEEFWSGGFFGTIENIKDTGMEIKDVVVAIKDSPTLGIDGFMNNYAQSKGSGETAGIAGSIIYSSVENKTTARVGDSTEVSAGSGVILNAANKVVYNNLAGVLDSILKPAEGVGGDYGIGGSLILGFNTHDAIVEIGNNAKITSVNGNLDMNAATDQTHINIAAGGGTAGKVAVIGSVAVVSVDGTTKASIGKNASINANEVNLNAGTAKIKIAKREGDPKVMGIDSTSNLIKMENESIIKDETKLITITGSLAKHEASGNETPEGGSAGGVAVGASVGVNVIGKNVITEIQDGTTITANKLNMDAGTKTQSASIAVAGAFQGGVSADKDKQDDANANPGSNGSKNQSMSNQGGWLDKITKILGLVDEQTEDDSAAGIAQESAKGDDISGNINDADNKQGNSGNVTDSISDANKDHSGGDASSPSAADNLTGSGQMSDTASSGDAAMNAKVAAAGSVNVTITDNNVSSTTGNLTLNVKDSINIIASQKTDGLNVSTGIANSKAVGAGAALNFSLNNNSTTAILGKNSTIGVENSSVYKPSIAVSAKEEQRAIDVAIGVGAVKKEDSQQGSGDSMSAAIGGSFNVSVINNDVIAKIDEGVKIYNSQNVDINAINTSELYKGAGALAINTSGKNSNVGAGIAANVNVFNKNTTATIENGVNINSSGNLNVKANGADTPTEQLVSVAVAGSVITGGSNSYSMVGSIGADVFVNTTKAAIIGATINSKSTSVVANNYIDNLGIVGAIQFSSSPSSYGVGVGSVVNVVVNDTSATITNSSINSNDGINAKSKQKEILNFIAANGGLTTGGTGGFVATVNGIVNVAVSNTVAGINNSILNSNGDITISSDYENKIQGITAVGAIALGAGNVVGGNLIANVYKNDNKAYLTNSDVDTTGNLKVSAISNEDINIIPVAVAITTSGSAAVAANIAANVIVNDTSATVSGNKTANGKIKAKKIDITAQDNTVAKRRGGTLAASGGSAAVGGSIAADVLVKGVSASMGDNTKVEATDKLTISAKADNSFGPSASERGNEFDFTSLAGIASSITDDKFNTTFADYEMTYDLAGGASAAVSGTVLAKVINNNVSATIGKNAEVKAASVDIMASNETHIRAIVGNITASGEAAVGVSMFINVAVGDVIAGINEGSSVTTTAGDLNINAESIHEYKSIMIVGSGSGGAAINGSVNVNAIVDSTEAYIGKNVKVDSARDIIVKANETIDVGSVNAAIIASGAVSVGAMAYVNTFFNKVSARIGERNSTNDMDKMLVAKRNVQVDANSQESFGATMLNIGGSGGAAVTGTAVINVIKSQVEALVSGVNIQAQTGLMDVKAVHNFNEAKFGDKSVNFAEYIRGINDGDSVSQETFVEQIMPIVTILGISGAGAAAVNCSIVVTTIMSDVNAEVINSTIATASGLNIDALSKEVVYDLVIGIAGSGFTSVGLTGSNNVIVSEVKAKLTDSTITKGNVNVKAAQDITTNAVLFTATGTGTGAAISGTEHANVFANKVSATISNTDITDTNANVNVSATNDADANSLIVIGSGTGMGAAISAGTIVNTVTGSTEAAIKNSSNITANNISVSTNDVIDIFGVFLAGTFVGLGADAGGYVPVNVISRDQNASIQDSTINAGTSTKVSANSEFDIEDVLLVAGFSGGGASISGSVITNVIDNTVNAFIKGSTINGTTLAVTANQDTNLHGGIASVNIAGLGVGGSAHVVANIFQDKVNAYINNSTLTNTSRTVSATSTETINFGSIAGAGGGLGGVSGSAIVNTINNTVLAYILGSTLNGGSTSVISTQTIDINVLSGGATVGGFAAIGGRGVVNVLSNKNNAYVKNTTANNITSLEVKATSSETLKADVVNVAASLGASAGISTIVNVIENDTHAYMDNVDSIGTVGAYKIEAKDTINIADIAGVASIGSAAGAASVNVNIINNNVIAEMIGGTINATKVDVNAISNITINTKTASLAGGLAKGIAGSAAVTSIGDRFENSDTTSLKDSKVSDSVNQAQSQANQDKQTVTVKDENGNSKIYTTATVSLNKEASTKNEGTVARINGTTINSTGDVNVNASNTFNGTATNAAVALGIVSAGATVLVTDMKYKTLAEIANANITTTGNVNVKSKTDVTAKTDAIAGTAGVISISGNVGYFQNDAQTHSSIFQSTINAGNKLVVDAYTKSKIDISSISESAGLVTVNVGVSIARDKSDTLAIIQGKSNIYANAIDITASNNITLTSELQAYAASATGINALVNLADSSSSTTVSISDSKVEAVEDLNLIASTEGVSVTTIVRSGGLGMIGGNVSDQSANANANYNVNINNGSNIKAKNMKIRSGVNKANTNTAGVITAEVTAKAASVSLADISASTHQANVKSSANVSVSENSTLTIDNEFNALVAISKNAYTGNFSEMISGVSIGSTTLNSYVGGNSNMDIRGTINAKVANVKLDSFSNAYVNNISKSISIVSGAVFNVNSIIKSSAIVNFGSGDIETLSIILDNTRAATTHSASSSVALASAEVSSVKNIIKGYSTINILGKIKNNKKTTITSTTNNNLTSTLQRNDNGLLALAKGTVKNNSNTSNSINFATGSEIESSGDVKVAASTVNTVTQQADTSGGAFISVRGGTLSNNIASSNSINMDGSIVKAKNITFNLRNDFNSNGSVEFNDDFVGFFSDSGAVIRTTLAGINNINIRTGSIVQASDTFASSQINASNFKQKVKSHHSGGSLYNRGESYLSLYDTNYFTLDGTSKILGNNIKIDFDSYHNLESLSDVYATHFAGQPASYASLEAYLNNYLTIAGHVEASENVSVGFMKNSNNYMKQDAWLKAQAAIASGDHGGLLRYNVNNDMNVKESGKIISGNSVYIDYTSGQSTLKSRVAYEKISRLFFGIPITVTGTSTSTDTNITQKLTLDGLIQAGKGVQQMLIDKDGNVTSPNGSFIEDVHYEMQDAISMTSEEVTQNAIDELTTELDRIINRLAELDNMENANESTIQAYNTELTNLNNILNTLSSLGLVEATAVSELVSGSVKTSTAQGGGCLGSTNNANGKAVSHDIFEWVQYFIANPDQNAENNVEWDMMQALDRTLSTYVYQYTYVDGDNNTQTANRNLTDAEKGAVRTAYQNEFSKFETLAVGNSSLQTYNGTVINTSDYIDLKNQYAAASNNVQSLVDNLNSLLSSIRDEHSLLITQQTDMSNQVTYLGSNPLPALEILNPSIKFKDISSGDAKIQINGLPWSSTRDSDELLFPLPQIYGNGNFKVLASGVLVDNYSNKNLIFGNISLGTAGGLTINGKNYNHKANTGKPVGAPGSPLLTMTSNGDIEINTYYDHNNPLFVNANPAEININGFINAPNGKVILFNDSGDIKIGSTLTARTIDIVASQGLFDLLNGGSNLNLKAGDRIIAGQDVRINAGNFDINGIIESGNNDRKIVITQDMIDNPIYDPTTGKTNLINIKGNEKTSYINGTNNLKAIINDNGEIELFHIDANSGSLNTTAAIGGSILGKGSIIANTGAGEIIIENQTNKVLVVNNINNNEQEGGLFASNVQNNDLTRTINKITASKIQIDSKGGVDVRGLIRNGIYEKGALVLFNNSNGYLKINSDQGVKISERKNGTLQEDTISAQGAVEITNKGDEGITVLGKIYNKNGDTTLNNQNTDSSKIDITATANIINDNGNTIVTNEGAVGIEIAGNISNKKDNININNKNADVTSEINVASSGKITADNGMITMTNNGGKGLNILGTLLNKKGDIMLTSSATGDKINVASGGSVTAEEGEIIIENEGDTGIIVAGDIYNKKGSITLDNKNINNSEINVASSGKVTADNGMITMTNNGGKGLNILGTLLNKKGDITLTSSATGDKINVANGGSVTANEGEIVIENDGETGIIVAGNVTNEKGNITINNKNKNNSKINIASTGKVVAHKNDITITNVGKGGVIVEGLINTNEKDITITNNDSNIVIGDADNSQYIVADKGDVLITQTNGNILNAGYNKQMIVTGANLTMNVVDGDIGTALASTNQNLTPGHTINGSTRDYTETVNVTVKGKVNAKVKNNNKTDDRLVNLRSKDADLNIDRIEVDGNVMITVADWKQADDLNANHTIPFPSEEYFHGYSVNNAASNPLLANIEGKNISIIASDNVGTKGNAVTVKSRTDLNPGATVSVEAENDITFTTEGNTTIWQMISKRGNIDLTLDGDNAVIREITSGKHLHILQKGKSLTIYYLGKLVSMEGFNDDLLYPHDRISIAGSEGCIVPDTIAIEVLDKNGGVAADSILNIYNAWAQGNNGGKGAVETIGGITRPVADIVLRADRIIANAYGSPDSTVYTYDRPYGLDASVNRTFNFDNPTDKNAFQDSVATGFNSYGQGTALVFDIRGVDQGFVAANNGGVSNGRVYYHQDIIDPIYAFRNSNHIPSGYFAEGDNRVKEVILSINSNNNTLENRGVVINNLNADNAYIDTRDLNLNVLDGNINKYGELRNGNRGGEGNYSGPYRWTTIVDNDFRRLVNTGDGKAVTMQLFTKKTGSFGLNMGNLISLNTGAPTVNYNPHEVRNLVRNENSFYRLTYKDDKIQEKTTTEEFKEPDKDTYKPIHRLALRFFSPNEAGIDVENPNITEVIDISRKGVAVMHDGSLTLKSTAKLKITYQGVTIEVDTQVVRLDGNAAGLKFINLDKTSANKILYINMLLENERSTKVLSNAS